MLAQIFVHGPQKCVVRHLAHAEAGLVHDGNDALMRLLNEIANDLELEQF